MQYIYRRKRGALGVMTIALLLLAACTEKAPLPATTRIEDIKADPSAYMGKSVIVSGEIEKLYGPRSFQLGGSDFYDSDIRVITAEPLPAIVRRTAEAPFMPDDIAMVTGTVRNVVVADVERDFGFDLDPRYEVELEGRPAIIANSVIISPRGYSGVSDAESKDLLIIQSLGTDFDRSDLIGKAITLKKIEVQGLVGDSSFWVGLDSQQKILVTFAEVPTPGKAREGQIAIRPGQRVTLTGIIKKMPVPAEAWLRQNRIDDKTKTELQERALYIEAADLAINDSAG